MAKAVIALSCKCPRNSILRTHCIFRFEDIKSAKAVWHELNEVRDITAKLIYANQEGAFYEDRGIWGGLRVFRTPAVSRNITSMSTSAPVNLSPPLSSALGCARKWFRCTLATCCLSIPLGTCPAGTVRPFISSCCHFHHTKRLPMLTFNRPSLTHLLIPLSARNRSSTHSALWSSWTNQGPWRTRTSSTPRLWPRYMASSGPTIIINSPTLSGFSSLSHLSIQRTSFPVWVSTAAQCWATTSTISHWSTGFEHASRD